MSSRIVAWAVLAACLFTGGAARATVTYDGTDGVAANFFDNNSQGACTGCHVGTPDIYYQNVVLDTYARAVTYASMALNAADWNDGVYDGEVAGNWRMPQGAAAQVTEAELTLLSTWIANGKVQNALPTVSGLSTGAAARYTRTLSVSTLNDNGADTSYVVEWRIVGAPSYTSSATYYTIAASSAATTVSTDSATWTGGGLTTKSISHSATGLTCGSNYEFRVRGVRSGSTVTTTSATAFSTSACPTVSSVTGTTTLTEDQAFSVTYNGNTGVNSWSLVGAPTGMTIGAATGVMSWSAANTPDSPTSNTTYNFSVRVGDGTSTTDYAASVTVTPVNDQPALATIPDNTATKNSPFSYTLGTYASDVDDANNGTALTWTLVSAPAWLSLSTTGVLSGTPGDTALASESVTVRLEDGKENGTVAVEDTFLITVSGTNVGPTLGVVSNQTVNEDATLTLNAGALVTDPDDANNGTGALVWSLSGQPTGMAVSNVGVISWTPTQASLDAGSPQTDKVYSNITVQVADGGENAALAASRTFSVTVTAVNDAPVVAAITDRTTSASSIPSFTASATDEDNAANTLTWSISSTPQAPTVATLTGMSIVATGATRGQISWSGTGANVPGTWTVTVTATDPQGSPLAGSTTFDFTIEDDDSDGVEDYSDNCAATANADQLNTDGDGEGDACDLDDDNDSLPDTVETDNGYSTTVAQDHGTLDKDGDGLTNLDEYTACGGDTSCTSISNDSVAPVVTPVAVADVTASGYLTPVDLNASATDAPDGVIVPNIYSVDGVVVYGAPDPYLFRPGAHEIVWEAYDNAGNRGTAAQTVNVKPLVTMGGSQVIGAGQTAYVPVRLIGTAPSYPVVVTFNASGASAGVDYTIAASSVQFDSPDTLQYIAVDVIDHGAAADKDLVLTLSGVTGDAVLADASQISYRLRLTMLPAPPEARLQVSQSGEIRPVVYADDGSFVVDALLSDPNGDLTASCDSWTAPGLVVGAGGSDCQVIIDPAAVAPGVYTITVGVTDGSFTVNRSIDIALAGGNAPVLSGDDTDGDGVTNDVEMAVDANGNGLLDYLDVTGSDSPESIQLSLGASSLPLMAVTDSGLRLLAGTFAMAAQATTQAGIQVYESQIGSGATPVIDTNFAAIGALYDFAVSGLGATTTTAHVVLPMTVVLLDNTRWRVLGANGKWRDFTGAGTGGFADSPVGAVTGGAGSGSGDALLSAPRNDDGSCPLPQDPAYTRGLTAGNACVQMVVTDGGPNDADGEVNGSVRVTAAPTVPRDEIAAVIPDDSQSGGSADFWTLMLLALAMLAFRRKEQVQ
ncbi:MAG: hypothetical protein K0S46_1332 [Moraxellaceae bacterium]|jgi:hypothetical protein|nr:hypothetical protein [Moraxellaceae bacterium]